MFSGGFNPNSNLGLEVGVRDYGPPPEEKKEERRKKKSKKSEKKKSKKSDAKNHRTRFNRFEI